MEIWLERVLWFAIIMVIVTTFGYPIVLALLGPLVRRHRRQDDSVPTVSLIIAAYNEEACIARKIPLCQDRSRLPWEDLCEDGASPTRGLAPWDHEPGDER